MPCVRHLYPQPACPETEGARPLPQRVTGKKLGGWTVPIMMQLHGPGVDVGLQVIIMVRQLRHLVNRCHTMPHALKLHRDENLLLTGLSR